jgi:uncharacterized phage-like protein YoqJ
MNACSFTGHRLIKDEHRSALPDLISRAVGYAYEKGCRTFFAGGAIGFDTEAARAVIKFRMSHRDVRLVLVLPCMDQADKWSERQRAVYEYTLSEADEVEYISERYTNVCLKERNRALADRGDIMIAYVGHSASGAAQTMRMAVALGKEVYNLYPTLEGK